MSGRVTFSSLLLLCVCSPSINEHSGKLRSTKSTLLKKNKMNSMYPLEIKCPICHSIQWQIGNFFSEETIHTKQCRCTFCYALQLHQLTPLAGLFDCRQSNTFSTLVVFSWCCLIPVPLIRAKTYYMAGSLTRRRVWYCCPVGTNQVLHRLSKASSRTHSPRSILAMTLRLINTLRYVCNYRIISVL